MPELFHALNASYRLVRAGGLAALLASAGAIVLPAKAQDANGAKPASTEPAPKLIVATPLAGPLSQGLVVIPYQVENIRILPVFGKVAAAVSPRLGHLHISVDDAPWHWLDASGEPLVLQGLPAGPHKITFDLANANHAILTSETVKLVVPEGAPGHQGH
ncbi:DUF6130 family protein [Rugamonas sp. CCM 8940]|uniref:DUF6130 family protein n=1 Tax=Rugamonas sp. CCM 8940 TaxID=2765359 RepID=UPI0018F4FD10|nr:DUF6130 family protein [Rugamonas sp. CCM 8940]MBJ7311238.1 hypothetical protein [Rugamonas sp. CCM 8940]